jgi:hypothetical protein
MTTETKFRGGLVMTLLGLIIMTFLFFQQQYKLHKCKISNDSLQSRCDSLHDELFNTKVEAGRYESTFEHLKEVNPKLGKEMENWMNHETE